MKKNTKAELEKRCDEYAAENLVFSYFLRNAADVVLSAKRVDTNPDKGTSNTTVYHVLLGKLERADGGYVLIQRFADPTMAVEGCPVVDVTGMSGVAFWEWCRAQGGASKWGYNDWETVASRHSALHVAALAGSDPAALAKKHGWTP